MNKNIFLFAVILLVFVGSVNAQTYQLNRTVGYQNYTYNPITETTSGLSTTDNLWSNYTSGMSPSYCAPFLHGFAGPPYAERLTLTDIAIEVYTENIETGQYNYSFHTNGQSGNSQGVILAQIPQSKEWKEYVSIWSDPNCNGGSIIRHDLGFINITRGERIILNFSKSRNTSYYSQLMGIKLVFNASTSPPTAPRPIISLLNVTSGTIRDFPLNATVAAPTNDTTPTLEFVTDVDSNCRIGTTNINYTSMTVTNDCSGGEGTTSHTCTTIAGDVYTAGNNQSIFASCVNLINVDNMTLTSTTGNLQLDILTRPLVNVTLLNQTIFGSQIIFGTGNYSTKNNFVETSESIIDWFKNGESITSYSWSDVTTNINLTNTFFEWGDTIILGYLASHNYGCCIAFSEKTNSSSILVGDEPPTNPLITYPSNSLNLSVAPVFVNVTANDNDEKSNLTFRYFVNGVLNKTSSVNTSILLTNDGTYNFSVQVNDNTSTGGNSTSVNFTFDTTPPTVHEVNISDINVSTTQNVVLFFNATDSLTGVEFCYFHIFSDFDNGVTYDNNVTSGNTCSTSFTFNASGNWSLRGAWAEDYAGNIAYNTSFIHNVTSTDLSISDALTVGECPTTTGNVLLLALMIFTSLFFVVLAIVFNIGFVGILGSVMLLSTSWFIVGCVNVWGYVLALVALLTFFMFVLQYLKGGGGDGF